MTVQQIAELFPNETRVELVFNNSAALYNNDDSLHRLSFGNLVVETILLPEEPGEPVTIEIKAVPERI